MNVQYEVVFDVFLAISFIGAIITAWSGYVKWDAARKEKRAIFLKDLIFKFREDLEIQNYVYQADHKTDVEMPEPAKDKALTYLSYICYLRKVNVISDDEFSFFEYELTRVTENEKARGYLEFIEDFAKKNGVRSPFVALMEYVRAKQFKAG